VTLVDFSENMLHEVPKVLGEYRNRFNIVCHDFFSVKFKKGSFDAIISSFAVHHTRSIEGYVKLYRRIRGWLRPGGIFACIDVVSGANPAWTEINENGWRKYLTGFFGKAKIDRIFANYRAEDSPISLPEHIFCLNKAGFSQTDILWKRYNFALYCGMK
jgi:tRNA (cmo5U34)-methyltransferase